MKYVPDFDGTNADRLRSEIAVNPFLSHHNPVHMKRVATISQTSSRGWLPVANCVFADVRVAILRISDYLYNNPKQCNIYVIKSIAYIPIMMHNAPIIII